MNASRLPKEPKYSNERIRPCWFAMGESCWIDDMNRMGKPMLKIWRTIRSPKTKATALSESPFLLRLASCRNFGNNECTTEDGSDTAFESSSWLLTFWRSKILTRNKITTKMATADPYTINSTLRIPYLDESEQWQRLWKGCIWIIEHTWKQIWHGSALCSKGIRHFWPQCDALENDPWGDRRHTQWRCLYCLCKFSGLRNPQCHWWAVRQKETTHEWERRTWTPADIMSRTEMM